MGWLVIIDCDMNTSVSLRPKLWDALKGYPKEQFRGENACPDITAALARAREILGFPPATELTEPHEVLHSERQTVETARKEFAEALCRAQIILKMLDRRRRGSTGKRT